jgi:hypothetical protein
MRSRRKSGNKRWREMVEGQQEEGYKDIYSEVVEKRKEMKEW